MSAGRPRRPATGAGEVIVLSDDEKLLVRPAPGGLGTCRGGELTTGPVLQAWCAGTLPALWLSCSLGRWSCPQAGPSPSSDTTRARQATSRRAALGESFGCRPPFLPQSSGSQRQAITPGSLNLLLHEIAQLFWCLQDGLVG